SGPIVDLEPEHGEIRLAQLRFVSEVPGRTDADEAVNVSAGGKASVVIEENQFGPITLHPADGAFGAPLKASASEHATIGVRRNRFTDNTAMRSKGGVPHSGAYLNGNGESLLEVEDNFFTLGDAPLVLDVQVFNSAHAVVSGNTLEGNGLRFLEGDPTPIAMF